MSDNLVEENVSTKHCINILQNYKLIEMLRKRIMNKMLSQGPQ